MQLLGDEGKVSKYITIAAVHMVEFNDPINLYRLVLFFKDTL